MSVLLCAERSVGSLRRLIARATTNGEHDAAHSLEDAADCIDKLSSTLREIGYNRDGFCSVHLKPDQLNALAVSGLSPSDVMADGLRKPTVDAELAASQGESRDRYRRIVSLQGELSNAKTSVSALRRRVDLGHILMTELHDLLVESGASDDGDGAGLSAVKCDEIAERILAWLERRERTPEPASDAEPSTIRVRPLMPFTAGA